MDLTLTDAERHLLLDADRRLADAQRMLNVVFATICAGRDIKDAKLVNLDGNTLTIDVIAPA